MAFDRKPSLDVATSCIPRFFYSRIEASILRTIFLDPYYDFKWRRRRYFKRIVIKSWCLNAVISNTYLNTWCSNLNFQFISSTYKKTNWIQSLIAALSLLQVLSLFYNVNWIRNMHADKYTLTVKIKSIFIRYMLQEDKIISFFSFLLKSWIAIDFYNFMTSTQLHFLFDR